MIKIFHNNAKIIKCFFNNVEETKFKHFYVVDFMKLVFKNHSNEKIVWCHFEIAQNVDFSFIESINLTNKIVSFQPKDNYLGNKIGFVEQSPFININKNVTYATWQMSNLVGAISCETLSKIDDIFFKNKDFSHFLNSVSKIYQPLGLMSFSEPKLLNAEVNFDSIAASNFTVFKFVKQHYKFKWCILLLINTFIFERKLQLYFFIKILFTQQLKISKSLNLSVKKQYLTSSSIDVIIPTIGRKNHLHDFLFCLKNQSKLPTNVIIVEQNPKENSISVLDYLTNESLPFKIKHVFTNQSGACNARNIAINLLESDYTFFADDDILIKYDFIEIALQNLAKENHEAMVFKCVDKFTNNKDAKIAQTTIFGSGCSIIKTNKSIKFNLNLEFGFGEDTDFGMQLRNSGTDVVYSHFPEILHLKAPIGGFRTPHVFAWQQDKIQPKPAPTITLTKLKYFTKQQLQGYKSILFLEMLKSSHFFGKFILIKKFNQQWKASVYWANKLQEND